MSPGKSYFGTTGVFKQNSILTKTPSLIYADTAVAHTGTTSRVCSAWMQQIKGQKGRMRPQKCGKGQGNGLQSAKRGKATDCMAEKVPCVRLALQMEALKSAMGGLTVALGTLKRQPRVPPGAPGSCAKPRKSSPETLCISGYRFPNFYNN